MICKYFVFISFRSLHLTSNEAFFATAKITFTSILYLQFLYVIYIITNIATSSKKNTMWLQLSNALKCAKLAFSVFRM